MPGDLTESIRVARAAYTDSSNAYIDVCGSMASTAVEDRELVTEWAATIDGLVVDVGCGPGQWTDHLQRSGTEVVGIDPVEVFIDHARNTYAGVDYRIGRAEDLPMPDAGVGGVMAWYSLIHTDPAEIDRPLKEFARVIEPGGSVLLGFFEGPHIAPFDHEVTRAWYWPVAELGSRVEAAGFDVIDTHTRTDPGVRAHGALIAVRHA